MNNDAVQQEILQAEQVIRALASKLQDAANGAGTLALSQQAFTEAAQALRMAATQLEGTREVIAESINTLGGTAMQLSDTRDVIAQDIEGLRGIMAQLSDTRGLITEEVGEFRKTATELTTRLDSIGRSVTFDATRISDEIKNATKSTNSESQNHAKSITQSINTSGIVITEAVTEAARSLTIDVKQSHNSATKKSEEVVSLLRDMRTGGLTWFRIIVVIQALTAIGVIAILIRILKH
jgi:chromosome segregation ATPase